MRYVILILFLLPVFVQSQYWGEQVLEKSFENSDLYFNSHYLNNFGLSRFKDISVNLVDDPFLNLYLNPAQLPKLERDNLFYLDFRGDRTDVAVIDSWVEPLVYDMYYYPRLYPDPRWYSQTRGEPEPLFSLGLLTYPFSKQIKNLMLGATYQLIYKQENFYTIPAWIYSNRLGYDAFGQEATGGRSDIPIQERSVGADEMLNEGHLITANMGYRFSQKLSAGIALNSVIHSREGEYLQIQNDEYGNIDNNSWKSHNGRSRNQNYDHLDFAGGIQYQFSSDFYAGVKSGYLKGKANQEYLSVDSSKYTYNERDISPEWSYHINRSVTDQSWSHDGLTRYASFNLTKKLQSGQMWKFYYLYAEKNIDILNSSSINDTSHYASKWVWDSQTQEYVSYSSLHDIRSGAGQRKTKLHQGMLSLHWKLTRKNFLDIGFFYSHKKSTINSHEPVVANRSSQYQATGYYPYEYNHALFEDKNLDWRYQASNWTIQIPILLYFMPSKHWNLMIGINKSLFSWHIEDQTIAYFDIRQKMENGQLKSETNFGELYREPNKNISEDYTDLIAKFEVKLSSQFGIHFLLNPDLEDQFRIAQWWLGFKSNL